MMMPKMSGAPLYGKSCTLVHHSCTRNVVSKTRFVAKKANPCTLVHPH